MACTSYYESITQSPVITGDANAMYGIEEGWVIGVQNAWSSNLRKIATLEGNKAVPDIVKGNAQITVLVPPTGYTATGALTSMSSTEHVDLCIHGAQYNNTFYTGGAVNTQDLGEGMKTLQLTKRFTIFGIAPTATS